jgi:hypothetical protein
MQIFSHEYYRTASNAQKGAFNHYVENVTKEIWARVCCPQFLWESFSAITIVIINNSNNNNNNRVKIL